MYLNLIQVAESLGVAEKVIQDWIRKEGMPHVSDRGRLLFDRAQVAHWAAGRGLAARAGFLAAERGGVPGGVLLEEMLRVGGIWRDVEPGAVIGLLERVVGGIPAVAAGVKSLLAQRLRAPGGINWAPVRGGLALPHFSARVTLGRNAGLIALVMLRHDFALAGAAEDGLPVRRLLFFVPPSPRAHLEVLGRLSRGFVEGSLAVLMDEGATDDAIHAAFGRLDGREGQR